MAMFQIAAIIGRVAAPRYSLSLFSDDQQPSYNAKPKDEKRTLLSNDRQKAICCVSLRRDYEG
eukprot:6187628-Pleurochrysis_carterae.AAC.1